MTYVRQKRRLKKSGRLEAEGTGSRNGSVTWDSAVEVRPDGRCVQGPLLREIGICGTSRNRRSPCYAKRVAGTPKDSSVKRGGSLVVRKHWRLIKQELNLSANLRQRREG